MADTAEGLVKKEIRRILEEAACYYHCPVTGGYGKSGALDFSVTVPPDGRALGVEAKSIYSPHGKQGPTHLQREHIEAIFAAGGIAVVINETNYELLRQTLHDIAHGKHDRARTRALGAYRSIPHRATDPLQGNPELPPPVLRRRR